MLHFCISFKHTLLKCALLNPIVKKNQLLMNGVNQYPIYIDEII